MKDQVCLWKFYHENSKIKIEKYIASSGQEFLFRKIFYKQYPRFPKIKLPKKFNITLFEKTIIERRSKREFKGEPISLSQLSKLLFFSAGITRYDKDWDKCLRAYPSAGARYPLEVYLLILNVEKVENGIYHYNVKYHTLELIKKGICKKDIVKYTCNQKWIKKASVIFVITAVFRRTIMKYDERGYRYVFLDCGHLAQNIYLVATKMKLGCCAIGGFYDDKINKMIGIDGKNESAIYLIAVGKNE